MTIKRIVICGSFKTNENKIHELAIKLKRCGFIVTELCDVPFHHTCEPIEKSANMNFYYKAIAECNAVIVYSDKHIGFETACEIGYALGCHKKLYFTHEVDIDGIKALLASRKGELLSDIFLMLPDVEELKAELKLVKQRKVFGHFDATAKANEIARLNGIIKGWCL